MSANTILGNEAILDLKGEPLRKDSANLLRALNHLMTVGTYYSLEHEQYLLASRKASGSIVQSIGDRPSVIIEIGSEGMLIGGQTIEPNHREVRQLHELLVPLNIARLEIDRGLQPDHLRTALRVLHEHRLKLGTSNSFQEVHIEGLPPTVRTIGCQLFTHDRGDNPSDGKSISLEDLARKFMGLVGEIIANLKAEPAAGGLGEQGARGGGGPGGRNPADFLALAKELEELARVETDPHRLLGLIQNAQQALDLSRDPGSVDMVFRLLRKTLGPGKAPRNKSRNHPLPAPGTGDSPGTKDDVKNKNIGVLREHLAVVAAASIESGALDLSETEGDFLGICFQILLAKPSASLEVHLVAAIELALSSSATGMKEVELCARWIAAALQHDRAVTGEHLLETVLKLLRDSHRNLLPSFWLALWDILDVELRICAWPFLVNDILLGTGRTPAKTNGDLLEAVGSIGLSDALRNRSRLFGMSAFCAPRAATTIFSAPPAQLSALHVVMLESPLAAWHGPHLRRLLLRRDPNGLPGIVMQLLGDFRKENGPLVAGLLEKDAENSISGEIKESVVLLLKDGVLSLPRNMRGEDWVIPALSWLHRLDHPTAKVVLLRLISEKRFFFFKAWPRECREAAERMVHTWNSASVI